jgi:hypothetical protein
MRSIVEVGRFGVRRTRKQALVLVMGLAAALAALGLPSAALAGLPQEFSVFNDCPVNTPGVDACVISTVSSGEFKIGSKTVAINKPVILQGGYNVERKELIPAADGNTLSKTALTVPGGLVGIEGLGGEVTATAELAGTVHMNLKALGTGAEPAVILPVKVKLSNPVLGNECYIGSNAEPIEMKLTTGTTSPPPPNTPISGKFGNPSLIANNKIALVTENTLVDNAFFAPGVNGCGLLPLLIDPIVDLDAGLPAAAGKNTAILNGMLESANANIVKLQDELPQVGKCEKLAGEKVGKEKKFTGEYRDSGCVEEAPFHEGQYEWTAGPGTSGKFTGKGAVATLETAKTSVKCSGSTVAGEYTGAKTATATVTLTGCTHGAAKESCQSSGAGSGEIVTSPLQGALGFIKDEGKEAELLVSVGLDLAHSPAVLTAQCGSAKVPLTVEGSVIAPITVIDKMVTGATLKYTEASPGIQAPEQFEGGPKDTLVETLGSGPEQAGLKTTVKLVNEGKLEIKAEVE